MTQDVRLDALTAWLKTAIDDDITRIEPASSDASARRYFRVHTAKRCYVAMDAPPDKEPLTPKFVEVADFLRSCDVNAPQVFTKDLEQGFLLLSDLGNTTYFQALQDHGRADELYRDAGVALAKMQHGFLHNQHTLKLASFDQVVMTEHLGNFSHWFIDQHLGWSIKERFSAWPALIEQVVSMCAAQPQVMIHFDYHCRNLMACSEAQGGNPGVIDFQDAFVGPLCYDLASLLRDAYISWSDKDVTRWARMYWDEAQAMGLDAGESFEQFMLWFDWTSVFRNLRTIGVFARLYRRDGKPEYLKDMALPMQYLMDLSKRFKALAELGLWLEQDVWPEAQKVNATC